MKPVWCALLFTQVLSVCVVGGPLGTQEGPFHLSDQRGPRYTSFPRLPPPSFPLSGHSPRLGQDKGHSLRLRRLMDLRLLPCEGQCMTRFSGKCKTNYACLTRRSLPWPTERR